MGTRKVAKTMTKSGLPEARSGGIPRKFDREVCCRMIFERFMTTDLGLHKILAERQQHLPSVIAFWQWLHDDDAAGAPLGLSTGFARAKKIQAEYLESQLLEIVDRDPKMTDRGVDGNDVRHMELRMKARHWLMERLDSKKYGARQTLAGDPLAPLGNRQDLSKLSNEELALLVKLQEKLES